MSVEQRRNRVATAWGETAGIGSPVVLIAAGDPILVPGRQDRAYPYAAHSAYFWLTDRNRPSSVLAFDAADGSWIDFVPPVAEGERVWEGVTSTSGSPEADAIEQPIDRLPRWLNERGNRLLATMGADTGWPTDLPALPSASDEIHATLHAVFEATRRVKDEAELARMRAAIAATAAGFATIGETLAAGQSEREIQVRLENAIFQAGRDDGVRSMAYDTIVGSGPNAAVLHFAPGTRRTAAGECLLIDAGGEANGYAADVTRTFAVGGSFGGPIGDIYGIVRDAQIAAVDRCRAGQEFRELHLDTAVALARGLQDLGILRAGDPQGLVDRDAHALFFPHGLGHLVGLGVRDASGYLPGRDRSERFGLAALRMDLPLAEGMVTTIEPGLYFIPALLQDPDRRAVHADDINWDLIDTTYLPGGQSVGGVRIEDNVYVTAGGPEVLTAAIPK